MVVMPLLTLTLLLFSCGHDSTATRAPSGSSPTETVEMATDGGAVTGSTITGSTIEDPPTTVFAGPPMTSCESAVHIGDSTSLGLTSPVYLPNPEDRIDAQYKRVGVTNVQTEISGARSIIEHLAGQENAADVAKRIKTAGYEGCWVFALGTTDSANMAAGSTYDQSERIRRMMEVVGDDPVLWVNVKTIETTGSWRNEVMAAWNDGLADATHTYPNIHVYDWAAVVEDDWFTDDGIHYTSDGYIERSRLIADALGKLIPAAQS